MVRRKYTAAQRRKIEKKEALRRKQIEDGRRIMSETKYQEMEWKKDMVKTQREWEQASLQRRDARLPYSVHMSMVSRGLCSTMDWGNVKTCNNI